MIRLIFSLTLLFSLLSSLLFSLLFASVSFAQVDTNNGSDDLTLDHNSAWFVGPSRKIKTCYVQSSNFRFPPERLPSIIQKAFDTWDQYIKDKKVGQGAYGYGISLAQDFKNLDYLPSTTIQLRPTCQGDEDLVFYFGKDVATPAFVTKAEGQYVSPTGFAQRQKYDIDSAWGRGFIFIQDHHPRAETVRSYTPGPNVYTTPDLDSIAREYSWDKYDADLSAFVLHEVGHVLGNGHVKATIMDEDIVKWFTSLVFSGHELGYFRNHIDGNHELFVCQSCRQEFPGVILNYFFNNLLHEGNERVTVSTGQVIVDGPRGSIILDFGDHTESFAYTIDDTVRVSAPMDLFKTFVGDTSTKFRRISRESFSGLVQHGYALSKSGKKIPIVIKRNTDPDGYSSIGPIEVDMKDPNTDYGYQPFFRASYR